jgi:FMN-binding domain
VIGKHLVIDYAVALEPDGRVRQVEILEYRESYGGEITAQSWLDQFVGMTGLDPIALDRDIRSISGATLSSRHMTEGVKRILALYATCLRWRATRATAAWDLRRSQPTPRRGPTSPPPSTTPSARRPP